MNNNNLALRAAGLIVAMLFMGALYRRIAVAAIRLNDTHRSPMSEEYKSRAFEKNCKNITNGNKQYVWAFQKYFSPCSGKPRAHPMAPGPSG